MHDLQRLYSCGSEPRHTLHTAYRGSEQPPKPYQVSSFVMHLGNGAMPVGPCVRAGSAWPPTIHGLRRRLWRRALGLLV